MSISIKNIIIAFIFMLVLAGCRDNHYMNYSKINSTDNKVICKYISEMATTDFGKAVVIDYNTITTYTTKNFNGYEKTIIMVNAKLGEEDFYIRIISAQTTDYYSIVMIKKQ